MNKSCQAGMLRRILALCLLCVAQSAVRAEDIDLFVGTPTGATDAPNVLIILDNTANWTTPFSNEMTALASVVNGLQVNKFRVGLMLFTETGGSDKGNDGAYVRAAMRLLDSSVKPKYQTLVSSLDVKNDKSNNGKVSKAMEEAWLYYSAGTPYAGNQKAKTDFTGNVGGTTASNAIYALSGNALSSKVATTYNNPIVAGCAKNFIIYISNGAAQDNTADLTQASSALAAAGGNTTAIPISPSGSQDNMADEWARFMKKSTQSITTYTVDINKVTTGQGPGWTALLKSMANVSSGKYFDVSSSGTQISDALNAIFSEIQATNSVFASVTLPISVSSQSTYLNQVFVGMFRPDSDSFPRWPGNLKQYKVGVVSSQLTTVDANGNSAINSGTGFITECARSFWTPTSLDNYWAFKPQGNCLTVTGSDVSNYPDGNIVEKGAQAYVLRQASSRTMKTCDPTTCTALTNFNTANTAVTQALLGAADATERTNLIGWAVGADNQDENLNANVTEMRPSVHGDVVHSRPAAVNYGTTSSPLVVVYYGANDGLLHAINGNRSGTVAGVSAGSEIWSFMPPEFYPRIKRLRDNTTTISFPGHTTGTPTPQPKDYGMDGSVSVVQQGTSTWIYSAMRRGGRSLYAFDVTTPASPTLKWKVGCPNMANDTGCSTGLSGMGQTWATPVPVLAQGYGSGASTILAMGGGYDKCEDADPNTCTTSSKGNHIYLMDADTGALLKTFDTDRGVVGSVALVTNSSGMIAYGYASDLGGNVYRISGVDAFSAIGSTAPANWTITKIASLGCATATSCTANRKFLYGPEVASVNGEFVILLGSGDREKPLLTYTSAASVANRFYALRDKPSDVNWLTLENATCAANLICNNSLLPITSTATPTNTQVAAYPKGWYLGLQSTEQVVTSALLLYNNITFSTHQPAVASSTSCSSLGTARVYNISYLNAAGTGDQRFGVISGGGLPPSPVAGRVQLDDGSLRDFIIGGSSDSPLKVSEPTAPGTSPQPKSWVFWDIER
ncbi:MULTISPECIES: pilus assembly protein [unclassified Pseudomonas]|uniref:pilus assembly protein n=1 Tax=unclassified Pseudomonas TaxID=196821 RepID=UPI000AFB8624|nr:MULTISPECIES: PilC/PilY family type IV pilus protein [unclassified Pseudomonas]